MAPGEVYEAPKQLTQKYSVVEEKERLSALSDFLISKTKN
jgi:hypothetical protein